MPTKLILALIYWPEGIRILLSSSFLASLTRSDTWDRASHDDFLLALCFNVGVDNFESLNLLADIGWPVYPTAWFVAYWNHLRAPSTYFAQLVRAMLNWKALQPKSHAVIKPDCSSCLELSIYANASVLFDIWRHVPWDSGLDNLYHCPWMSLTLVNALWEAGFERVDNLALCVSWACGVPSTPLWIQASELSRFFYRSQQWDIMEWFVEKGARLDWVHPVLRITPAHRIGLAFGGQSHALIEVEKFFKGTSAAHLLAKVLPMEHLDECFCHCSIGGCYAIGCAAKILEDSLLHRAILSSGERLVLDIIAKVIDSTRFQPSSLGLAVIRILTFKELSLTHTCCMPSLKTKRNDHDNEIRDIHEMEREDIEMLEDLMTEFEQTWKEHQGTFHEYLDGVWRVRMEEMLGSDLYEPSAEYIERIKRAGVILWEPFGPNTLQHESYQYTYEGPCTTLCLSSNSSRLCTLRS